MPSTAVAVLRPFREPVLTLWPYLSRPELLDRWLGTADMEVAIGGAFHAELWNGDLLEGTVLAVAPPSRLDLSWRFEGPNMECDVRIRLEHAGPGSRVRVEQDAPATDLERAHACGWWREAMEALHRAVDEGVDARQWGAGLPIVLRTPLSRTPADIWPLLSTARGLEKWLAGAERFEATPGGSFRFISRFQGNEVIEEGRVLAIEVDRLVELEWEWIGQGWEKPTRVELRLEADPSGVALILRHSGFGALVEEQRIAARRNYAAAWRDVLHDLQRLVAPGPDGRLKA